jgi:hypothetical protein
MSLGTPAAADEGSPLRFPVTLSRATNVTVTANLATQDGTAVAPGDYTAQSQVKLTIPAGQTQAFLEVPTVDDGLTETDETVKARITGGNGATAGTLSATGTISDVAAITITRGGILGGQLVSGTIKVKLPHGGGFIDLGDTAGLPVGTIVDATDGVIELTSAVASKAKFASASARKLQHARFRDGIFTIRQGKRSALVTLVLSGPELKRCGAGASAAAKKKVRRLWGDGKGRFRTKGKYAAGTVRGTKWLTEDRCGSTRVKVARGRVAVRDLVRRKTRVVRAGRSLTVRARR